jgi:hypothetical protein
MDRLLEVGDAHEGAAPNALGSDLGEEALDQIEPGCAGWREVQPEARMLCQPRLHLGCLVRSVVVEHEMDAEVLLHAPVDPLQEADEFLGTMARLTFTNDETARHIERSEQRRRAVALVVVRQGRRAAISSRAGPAVSYRAPGSDSFRRRTGPAPDPAGSCRARRHRRHSPRIAGRSISLNRRTRCGLRPARPKCVARSCG